MKYNLFTLRFILLFRSYWRILPISPPLLSYLGGDYETTTNTQRAVATGGDGKRLRRSRRSHLFGGVLRRRGVWCSTSLPKYRSLEKYVLNTRIRFAFNTTANRCLIRYSTQGCSPKEQGAYVSPNDLVYGHPVCTQTARPMRFRSRNEKF